VSLINEALRKARQAASEHDSKQAEDPFRPARAYPSRRSGRPNDLLVVALFAVAAGAIVASAVWWFFGSQHTAPPEVAAGEPEPIVVASLIETPLSAPATDDEQVVLLSTDFGVVEAPTQQITPAEVSVPTSQEIESEPVQPAKSYGELVSQADGERVYVVEANLGDTTLSLGFIVARSENPFAEINGVDVYLGSEIEGFVVEAIEADRVVLRDDQGTLVLRVP
jgi:hypothetical protein